MENDLVKSLEDAMKELISLATRSRSEVTLFAPEITTEEIDRRMADFCTACRKLEAVFILKQQSVNPPSDAQLEREIGEIRAEIEEKKATLLNHRHSLQQCKELLDLLAKKQSAVTRNGSL